MDKYNELHEETAKRAEQRRELVKKIEKREKTVSIMFNVSIWFWLIVWWVIWNIKIQETQINFFLSLLIFIFVLVIVDFILYKFFWWVHRNIGKTVK